MVKSDILHYDEKVMLLPVLDRTKLSEASDGDAELEQTLTLTFLDGASELLDELQRGIKVGDFASTKRAAHSLKGEADLLGGMRVKQFAAALERAAAATDVEACRRLFTSLSTAVSEFSAALGAGEYE